MSVRFKGLLEQTRKFITFFLIFPLLAGCVPLAAVPVFFAADAAITGFFLFKTVQLSTGGSVSVGFKDKKVSDDIHEIMKRARSIAIWPGDQLPVIIADKLEKSEEFKKVITPSMVSKIMDKLDIYESIAGMTEKERLKNFSRVCKRCHADVLLALRFTDTKSGDNSWSFKRPYVEDISEIYLYDRRRNKIIYNTLLGTKWNLGSKFEYNQAIKITGETVAEKILQLKHGKDALGKSTETPPPTPGAKTHKGGKSQ